MIAELIQLAHYHSRKADFHLRCRRFDESIESYQKAADFLKEAIQTTNVPKALESLHLQLDYHLKHKELVRMKKDQFEKYRYAVEQQKQKSAAIFEKKRNSCQLQMAIYKTMEDADCLLDTLCHRNSNTDTESLKSTASSAGDMERSNIIQIDESNESVPVDKKPKDNSVVIEELKTLNHQLHILVYNLVSKLDESNHETDSLREKVKWFEKQSSLKGGSAAVDVVNTEITDISETTTAATFDSTSLQTIAVDPTQRNKDLTKVSLNIVVSSTTTSDSDDLSPLSNHGGELPPLELPDFDFSTFDK